MVERPTIEQTQQRVVGNCSRGDAPATSMEVDLAVIQAHAQWWTPVLKSKLEATPAAAVEGADGAISAWVADERNRILGQELTPEDEEMHADLVIAGKQRNWRLGVNFMYSHRVMPAGRKNKFRPAGS